MDYFTINFERIAFLENNFYLKHKRQNNTFNNRLQAYDLHAITML